MSIVITESMRATWRPFIASMKRLISKALYVLTKIVSTGFYAYLNTPELYIVKSNPGRAYLTNQVVSSGYGTVKIIIY